MTIDDLNAMLADHARARGDREPLYRVTVDVMTAGGPGCESWRVVYFPERIGSRSTVAVGATAEDAWANFQAQTEVPT